MKSYTDLEQSKKLAEILSIESADMFYYKDAVTKYGNPRVMDFSQVPKNKSMYYFPCWSVAALLNVIKDKCDYFEFVYLKRTSDGRANSLVDVYRLSTDVYDVYNKEAVDACVEMISKLHDLKII